MRNVLKFCLTQLLIVTVIISTVLQLNVYAVSNVYDLDELGLKLRLPSEYMVITRETSANANVFSKLGTTKSELISQFEANNIYLNAISTTYDEEIVVTMMKNDFTDFAKLSDTALSMMVSTLVDEYSDLGIDISNHKIYEHSQAKFIMIYFIDTSNGSHGLQYYTIYNGKAMNFTIRSYTGNLSVGQESTIKKVVESIKYDNAPPEVDLYENTDSFIYNDIDSGVTFTVPENWKQKEFAENREFLDVKFVSTKDLGCTIIFGSTDIWEQMPAADKVGYTRYDLNNSIFTKSDIAEMYGTTSDKISMVTYDGIEYYKGETISTQEEYGLEFTITMTQLVYINNGWMYSFQFSGSSDHKFYSDFETLLKSVQYTDVSQIDGSGLLNSIFSSVDSFDVLLVVIISVSIVVVVSLMLWKKNSQKRIKIDHAYDYASITFESQKNLENIFLCQYCGQSLPSDSDFCHVCGKKISKGE